MISIARICLTVLVTGMVLFIKPQLAHAEINFSVEPAIIETTSSSSSAQITLSNSGDTELHIIYSTAALEVKRDGVLVPKTPLTPVPGITFISKDENEVITLAPGASIKLDFLLNTHQLQGIVPALLFTTDPQTVPEDKTVSSVSGAIVVPILQSGKASDQRLNLTRFSAPIMTFSNRVPVTVQIENLTDTLTRASGVLIIKNIAGREIERFPIASHYIFPHTLRSLDTIVWEPSLLIGIYRIELDITYGNNRLQKKTVVIGLPIQYATTIFIAGLIASGIYLRVRKYRS
ncbi:MAG TPA: hypothetical protein PLD54_03720 [Candidatus Levybacteria bacterium]|nr:hypothetical protein [Candidatus Levybacteria bacterium]